MGLHSTLLGSPFQLNGRLFKATIQDWDTKMQKFVKASLIHARALTKNPPYSAQASGCFSTDASLPVPKHQYKTHLSIRQPPCRVVTVAHLRGQKLQN
eukprot:5440260-Pyramimonas_sp.AAC.1